MIQQCALAIHYRHYRQALSSLTIIGLWARLQGLCFIIVRLSSEMASDIFIIVINIPFRVCLTIMKIIIFGNLIVLLEKIVIY